MAGAGGRGDLYNEEARWPLGLGILPYLIFLRVGGDNPLHPFQAVADDENRMGQGHAALCLHVDAETGATYLVGLG